MKTMILSFLSRYKIYVLVAALLFAFAAGAFVTHRLDTLSAKAKEAEQAEQNLAIWKQAYAKGQASAKAIAAHEAANSAQQNSLEAHAIAVIKEVPNHVKESPVKSCISYGFVRVLDAEVNGVLPEQLNLPDGKSDDDCAPLSAAAVASGIISNFKIAKQNEQQLNELIGALHDLENENSEK